MKFYLLSALLLFSSLAFCQEKKEEPTSEKEEAKTEKKAIKDKSIPPTPLSTRKIYVRYAPRYVNFQDTKQNDIHFSGLMYLSANIGKQWFTRRGNIFNIETRAATGSLTAGQSSTFLGYSADFSYLFDVKKYHGWDFYLGPEVNIGFYSKINLLLTNSQVYSSLESPFMVKFSAVKEIKKHVFRFDLGLSLFTLIAETNSFPGAEYRQLVQEGRVDFREYTGGPFSIFDFVGVATLNRYFRLYTNITYQLNTRIQFNYLWSYTSYEALNNYPTRYGHHNIGVAYFIGKMKKLKKTN